MNKKPVQFYAADSAFDVVAMASSAGGLSALSQVISRLPGRFPAAVLVVQHLDPHHPSMLAEILSRRTELSVQQAVDGETLRGSTIYIAPPDQHLLVNPDAKISLTRSELVHFVRPSADLLFESVAATFKERSIAVVLTGTGRDGSMGVQAIKKMGGVVIAQDQSSSEYSGMPDAAIATGAVDHILPLEEIAAALVQFIPTGDVR
jgi:two-component system chemotaxis response regulator CheB